MDNKGLLRIAGSVAVAFTGFLLLLLGNYFGSKWVWDAAAKKDDIHLSNWKFSWSSDRKALEEEQSSWSLATADVPIVKPFDRLLEVSYIRLNTGLPALKEERILELVTAGNPIKVKLDGKEIYNNHYGKAMYTGNRLNEVILPAKSAPSDLDIFVGVQNAYSFSARITTPESGLTVGFIQKTAGLVIGCTAICIGIIILLLLLFTINYKGFAAVLWLSFLTVSQGIGVFLSQLSLYSVPVTSPVLWKIQIANLLLSAVCLAAATVSTVDGGRVPEKLILVFLSMLIPIFLLVDYRLGVWIMLGFPLVMMFTSILTLLRLWDSLKKTYLLMVSAAFLAGVLCLVFDATGYFTGWGGGLVELRHSGIFVFCMVMFIVQVKRALHINIRLEERELQEQRNKQWVERAVTSCAGIFAQQSIEGFCRETVRAMKELILFDGVIENQSGTGMQPALAISIAFYDNGDFVEVYTENNIEKCSYNRILARAKSAGGKPVLFGEHTLDMIFYTESGPNCILHVDRIKNRLSSNLQNTLRSTYRGIALALNSLELKENIVELQESVFINLAEIAESKQNGTGDHLKIVSEMVNILCSELNMSEHERHLVSMASMVHDIGKLAIPDTILCKNGRLTEDEFAVMQDHVIYGYNIMSKSPGVFMAAAAVIAQQHHEKYDGTGYIELKGDQIHLYARIVAIVDVFEALLSKRPYKEAWTAERACSYITSNAGAHFDPQLVRAFERCKDRLIAIKNRYTKS